MTPSIAVSIVVLALLGLAAAVTTPLPQTPGTQPTTGAAATTAAAAAVPIRTVYVTRLTNAGKGSLRAALHFANARRRRSITVIYFRRHGVIRLRRALSAINRTVLIDGTSAPTHLIGGPPVVELNCAGHAGLLFGAGANGSQLLGLAVDHASGNGVSLSASSVTINDDYLGLNLARRATGATASTWRAPRPAI